MVRDYHGYFQRYSVQAAATREQIVVAAEVTRAATDVDELHPTLEAVNRKLKSVGWRPMRVLLADAAYYSDANVRGVGENGPGLVIATRSNRNRRPAEILERAGLPRVTFYQLRHTGATLMLAQGVPLEQVSEVTGPSTIEQTRRYAQIVEPLRREAAAPMEAFMRGESS